MKQNIVPNYLNANEMPLSILHSLKKEYIQLSCQRFAATQDDARKAFEQAEIIYIAKKKTGKLEELKRPKGEYLMDLSDRILVIKLIKEGNERVLTQLYRSYRDKFCSWIFNKFRIKKEDAEDIFQEAMLAFHNNIINEKLVELTTSIEGYLWIIGKNKAINFINKENVKKNKKEDIIQIYVGDGKTSPRPLSEGESLIVKTLQYWPNKSCSELLNLFYWKGFSMEAIARELDLKNADSAKTKKSTCLKKLKTYLINTGYK